jgi:hypothetical protein
LTLDNGEPSTYPVWSVLERNFIISFALWANSPNNDWCIDWDDGASFYLARDNVCVYGNIKTHGSGSKYIYRNLLMYSDVPSDGHACITAQSAEGDCHVFNNTCQMSSDDTVLEQAGCDPEDPLKPNTLPAMANNRYFLGNFNSSGSDPNVGCLPLSKAQAVGVDRGSTAADALPVQALLTHTCKSMEMSSCPPLVEGVHPVYPKPPPPPPPSPGFGCAVKQSGFQCIPDVCASDGVVSGRSCANHMNPDHKHGCTKGDWKCAVPASAKICDQVPSCVSFSLSDKDWDDVKLYFGNATLVPNDDWVLWRRKS